MVAAQGRASRISHHITQKRLGRGNVSEGKRIVFLDVVTSAMRKVISENCPPGFDLVFAEADTEEKAIAAVRDADFVLVWSAYVPTRVVEAARKARLILKIGEGTDRIDVAAAARLGIPVARTSGSNAASVAEMASLLILATLRWLPRAHNSTVAGQWLKWELRPGSYEVRGKQVGIVGLGKIGKMVARQMRGFGPSLVYHDVVRQPEAEAELGLRLLPLEELLRTSDIVTLHVPGNPSTRGLIGRTQLALMKPTAILVNTCRAVVVDEESLYEALRDRKIRGAGIDVFAKEPPGANNPLFSLDNVVVTPHSGGGTEDAEITGVRMAYATIARVAAGQSVDPADLAPVPK
jgi:D-3-phosphoglycerate dehydrogenase